VLVQQLTDDFLNGTGKAYPVIDRGGEFPVTSTSPNQIDGQVESPDLFKRGNRYCRIPTSFLHDGFPDANHMLRL
jgi:hypothetical protein